MPSQYAQLDSMTTIVADTGDVQSIQKYVPTDATTNPSLLLKASEMKEYKPLVDDALQYAVKTLPNGTKKEQVLLAMDKLAVNFGCEILKIVPGVVSTEVDARLSFDTAATIKKAHELIALYKEAGIEKERVLIKIATTWEGIEAARVLEAEGIHVNMTLLFNFAQAVAAGDAKATLISPFVGRIRDYFVKSMGVKEFTAVEDPGVISVTEIYNYYKKFGYATVVMGASFRNKGEILQLAGCDKLTIAPKFLDELKACEDEVVQQLATDKAQAMELEKVSFDEASFRWALNEDAMATEKLAEGIRNFAKDIVKLENTITKLIAQ